MESILTSVKKLLGITEDYTHFDADIIMHINTTFTILNQLGVGPSNGFFIEDDTRTWDEFIPLDDLRFNSLKTYMYMRVKLMFDPPLSSAVMASMERQISELEWRLNSAADYTTPAVENESTKPSIPSSPSSDGTTDYTKLKNLPSINGKTLIGNYNEKDPTVNEMTEDEVIKIVNDVFNEE